MTLKNPVLSSSQECLLSYTPTMVSCLTTDPPTSHRLVEIFLELGTKIKHSTLKVYCLRYFVTVVKADQYGLYA